MFEVNEKGLAEIRKILSANAKAWQGVNPDEVSMEAVLAYANDAEAGDSGSFEIRASQSVTGNPQVFYISDDGIDAE